jgi:hypothetical protein
MRAGHPIAMVGVYEGEYHFEGRLSSSRIDVVTAEGAAEWMHAHASGLLLQYHRGHTAPTPDGMVARHPFRSGWATLSTSLPLVRNAVDTTASGE